MPTYVVDRLSRLSEGDHVRAYCTACKHSSDLDLLAIKLAQGDLTFDALRRKLKCSRCGSRRVNLTFSHSGEPTADWRSRWESE